MYSLANRNLIQIFDPVTGAKDYITQPFDTDSLKIKIDNLLSLRNSLPEQYNIRFICQPGNVILDSGQKKFLEKALKIIEKYMDDPDFNIKQFASEIACSRMQLYRKLKYLTRMTVKEFIRDLRLKRAAQLLEQNELTVSEIIYRTGFQDFAHFRKCFRKQYHLSPSEYAARFKNKNYECSIMNYEL